jgi:hypothetical protein
MIAGCGGVNMKSVGPQVRRDGADVAQLVL